MPPGEGKFLTDLESFYGADSGVTNFPEEFLVVNGRYGLHVVTLVPITLVPYSPDGLPTIGVVLPLDGPHWLPVRAGDFSPRQYLIAEVAKVHFISGDH